MSALSTGMAGAGAGSAAGLAAASTTSAPPPVRRYLQISPWDFDSPAGEFALVLCPPLGGLALCASSDLHRAFYFRKIILINFLFLVFCEKQLQTCEPRHQDAK